MGYKQPIHPDSKLREIRLTSISKLSPYSGVILTTVAIILFILKQYIIEGFLMTKLYGDKYRNLKDIDRRGFINNHIAGGTKFLIMIVGAYPFISVAFRDGTVHTPYAPGSVVTLGDILVVLTNMLTAMYLFELVYRIKISPVSSIHHVGAAIISQTAIAISLNLEHEQDATIEFILVTVWGAFDIVCEMLPHISVILYRVYPSRHLFLARIFLCCAITTFFGTICETAVVMYLFGSLWYQWTISFKVATPILHVAFSCAQLHGSRIFFKMWKRQVRFMKKDEELATTEAQGTKSAGSSTGGSTREGGAVSDDGIVVTEVSHIPEDEKANVGSNAKALNIEPAA